MNAQSTLNAAAQATANQRLLNAQNTQIANTGLTLTAIALTQVALENPTVTPYVLPTTSVPVTKNCPGFVTSRVYIGGYARVTPGDPNRLRDGPGGNYITEMPGGSVMLILAGPECTYASDGLGIAWWQVQWKNPDNGRTYTGWTAEGKGSTYYLEPVGSGAEVQPTSVNTARTPPPSTARNTVPSEAIRLGEFQVEWYCNQRGYGVKLTNNDADWACTNQPSGNIAFILRVSDFDSICTTTYGVSAFAIRDQNRTTAAYNWSCYRF